MTYIEKLQDENRVLREVFVVYKELEAAETRFENTAYKADARKIADAVRQKLNNLIRIIEPIIAKTKIKEAVNA